MDSDDERCADGRRFQRIDDAFRQGDLEALRAAVDDPAHVPNGPMPDSIGPCLIYAIYHSPPGFIRRLLELGADPNAPVDDGFPPLIAALSCAREVPGATRRTDADAILRLLLSFGADPNQRGINDYTPLHMAVAQQAAFAIPILLDGGADPELRTRIDEHETPLEMARSAGLQEIASLLERGPGKGRRLRSGLRLLEEIRGTGEIVRRQHQYRARLRLWLENGAAVRQKQAWGPVGRARLEDNGETLITDIFINRGQLMSGLFYGVTGMRVGGMRRLHIAPHLAYGRRGVPDVIPANAPLIAEVTILEEHPLLVRP